MGFPAVGGVRTASRSRRSVTAKKRGEADSEGRLERSEGKKPRFAPQICILPKSQRKRPSALAASQRDKEAPLPGGRPPAAYFLSRKRK